MKRLEWRDKSKAQLQKLLRENQEKLRGLRFDLAAGKLKKVREIRKSKKEIARLLTILNLKSES